MAELIVALDVPELDEALSLADELLPEVRYFKLGLSLFCAAGPRAITEFKRLGAKVFLDLKLHDIPAQVAGACRVIGAYGVDMVTVHTPGGVEMMRAAKEGLDEGAAASGCRPPLAVGVTVLTSLDESDLQSAGFKEGPREQVRLLASLAEKAGLDGVVASAQELGAIHEATARTFKTVTPGIRPEWAATGDQKRIVTPAAAAGAGADYIVVGRPITGTPAPIDAARRILDELSG